MARFLHFLFFFLAWCAALGNIPRSYPPGGSLVVSNYFDKGGNLWQVRQQAGTNVFYTARGFNALGQSTGATFGNGVVTTNDYFANSKRLRRMVSYKTGSTNIQNLTYSYDQASNLKSIADGTYAGTASASLTNLLYDDLHRLTSLTRPAMNGFCFGGGVGVTQCARGVRPERSRGGCLFQRGVLERRRQHRL